MRFGNFVGSVALLIAIYIVWKIRFILLLVFAAIALATALNYLVKCFERLRFGKIRLSRVGAVGLALLTIVSLLSFFIFLIVPPFVEQVRDLLRLLPLAVIRTEEWLDWLESRVPIELFDQLQRLEGLAANLPNIVDRLFALFDNFYVMFVSSVGLLVNVLLVIFITLMLLANPRPYRRTFLALFPAFYRRRAAYILRGCEEALVGWTKGILFNMLVISGLSWIGLTLLDIPLPLANALLAGLLTFIPNVGPVLSVVPPAVLALLEDPWKVLAVVGLYILIQQLESNLLTPLVMKQQVSLLPAITLISQASFAVFFGLLGLFLALPITVVLQVWFKELLIKDILTPWRSSKQRRFDRQGRELPQHHRPLLRSDQSDGASSEPSSAVELRS
ncbi:MAG: AI-2E family transporter [Leptolyngbya sp. SIO4C1]|nr:AI-2E family transporter [Leptolyngbya sp. SIO4C1]